MPVNAPRSPLTGHEKVTLIRKYRSADLVDEWMNSFKIDISHEISSTDEILKYRCDESDLFFYLPSSLEGGGMLYQELAKNPWYYIPEKWEHKQVLGLCKSKTRILEVGCGGGEFLKLARKKNCFCDGLEINPSVQAEQSEEGVNIHDEKLGSWARENEASYDIVCAFQVLEHIAEPKDFIKDCVKATTTRGKIIFGTPNSQSFIQYSHNLLDLPPHHMGGWNENAFKYLERLFPIKLEKIIFEPLAPYHDDYYLATMSAKSAELGFFERLLFQWNHAALFRAFIGLGGRKFVKGQSMLAVFSKI
jgi:2-polyprenyl-3-methyl-5-hydroxy-6-metoxy-1,4-benzoquinol methylase